MRLTIPIDLYTIENDTIGGGALDVGQGIDEAKEWIKGLGELT